MDAMGGGGAGEEGRRPHPRKQSAGFRAGPLPDRFGGRGSGRCPSSEQPWAGAFRGLGPGGRLGVASVAAWPQAGLARASAGHQRVLSLGGGVPLGLGRRPLRLLSSPQRAHSRKHQGILDTQQGRVRPPAPSASTREPGRVLGAAASPGRKRGQGPRLLGPGRHSRERRFTWRGRGEWPRWRR